MLNDVSKLADRAIREMQEYQAGLCRDPEHASVVLGGLRHALIPTHVLARDLPEELESIFGGNIGPLVMSRLGRVTGRAQATAFFADRGGIAEDSTFRVLCGPVYFAWAGYGDVDLLLWETGATEGDFAILWESANSFSANEAVSEGDRGRSCHLQAGYAAGWCEVATGMQLETAEIACRAEGVSHCRFLIAPSEGFGQRILNPRFHRASGSYATMHLGQNGIHTPAA